MRVIEKYVDELSGREFKTKAECIKSEKKNGGIKKLFSFWKPTPEDQHCNFANGGLKRVLSVVPPQSGGGSEYQRRV